MKITVVCQVCFEKIAIADTKELSVPIRGSMFKSKDPGHGHPDPFPPAVEWQFMKCPYGNHRPFYVDDVIPYDSGEARKFKYFDLNQPWEEEKVQVFEPPKPEEKPTPAISAKPVVHKKRGRKPTKSVREKILEADDAG